MKMVTDRQREVLEIMREQNAIDAKSAMELSGADTAVGLNLARKGIINVRVNANGSTVCWIRSTTETPTGALVACGYVIILNGKEVTTPSGRRENFFLARTREADFTIRTFDKHFRGWLKKIGFRPADLISTPIEIIGYDSPVFSGDHVILGDDDWKANT